MFFIYRPEVASVIQIPPSPSLPLRRLPASLLPLPGHLLPPLAAAGPLHLPGGGQTPSEPRPAVQLRPAVPADPAGVQGGQGRPGPRLLLPARAAGGQYRPFRPVSLHRASCYQGALGGSQVERLG